jgi:hypothetical protein
LLLASLEGNQQDLGDKEEDDIGTTEAELASGTPPTGTSFSKWEFLCPLGMIEGHLAEAGIMGVLKSSFWRRDAGDVAKGAGAVVEGTVDSPT